MAITTRDQLINAMGNNSSRLVIDKANIGSQTANSFSSLWRATGQPGQGAIPTTAAVCNGQLIGAIRFEQQSGSATSYLALLEAMCSNASSTLEIHDRLMHMGGLSGNVTAAQTVNLDISANLANDNLEARKGDANFSDVQWWLEWYTATGSTTVTVTVNVTYDDGSTGNLTGVSMTASRPAAHMIPINSLIPSSSSGRYIRAVNTVSLSATSGTAGNFGVTATRYRAALFQPVANARFTADWAGLGLPEIPNSACLFCVQQTTATSTGAVRATGKIIHG